MVAEKDAMRYITGYTARVDFEHGLAGEKRGEKRFYGLSLLMTRMKEREIKISIYGVRQSG
jgi:hypothetical protein